MTTTAKVICSAKGDPVDGQVTLGFTADYNDGRNKEWAKYTPALILSMTVTEEVADRFPLRQPFLLAFEACDE